MFILKQVLRIELMMLGCAMPRTLPYFLRFLKLLRASVVVRNTAFTVLLVMMICLVSVLVNALTSFARRGLFTGC